MPACCSLGQQPLRESGFVKVAVAGRAGDSGTGVVRMNLLSFDVLILTTGSFTADARREVTRYNQALCELLKERGLGVRVEPVVIERVRTQPDFFAAI